MCLVSLLLSSGNLWSVLRQTAIEPGPKEEWDVSAMLTTDDLIIHPNATLLLWGTKGGVLSSQYGK